MLKKIINIILLFAFLTSCADTFDSVKRGLTGAKKSSADEFLVKKKDPLILPPDYDSLPSPDERTAAKREVSTFEKSLGSAIEEDTQEDSSAEESILKQIQSQ